jgi:hypothetical protein
MNECTLKDMKYGRKQTKVIDESQSPAMQKRMNKLREIEDKNNEPKITDREYFDQLFNSMQSE